MATALRTLSPITVATAGTRVQLGTFTPEKFCRSIRFEADKGNTGNIFVGDLNVSATQYTTILGAKASLSLSGSSIPLSRFWFDADANGSKVQITVA